MHEYKEKLLRLFENGIDEECDSIIGAASFTELTELHRDHKYLNANIWGKCALRMAAIIKQLNPRIFFGAATSTTNAAK